MKKLISYFLILSFMIYSCSDYDVDLEIQSATLEKLDSEGFFDSPFFVSNPGQIKIARESIAQNGYYISPALSDVEIQSYFNEDIASKGDDLKSSVVKARGKLICGIGGPKSFKQYQNGVFCDSVGSCNRMSECYVTGQFTYSFIFNDPIGNASMLLNVKTSGQSTSRWVYSGPGCAGVSFVTSQINPTIWNINVCL